MGRRFQELELQSIRQDTAATLTLKDEVSVSLREGGILQVLVRFFTLAAPQRPSSSLCRMRDYSYAAFQGSGLVVSVE